MLRFARTYAVAVAWVLGGGGLISACGHLPLEELPSELGAGGPGAPDGGTGGTGSVDGSVGAGPDGSAADADCGPGCEDESTFVAVRVGDDTNPGTKEKPVKSIGRGIEIAVARGGKREVRVAGGRYDEKVIVVEGISLLGGHACDAQPCGWDRSDIVKNDSAIFGKDYEGLLVPKNVTASTRIEGFRIEGKGGAAPIEQFGGSRGMTIRGGAPTVRSCRILGAETAGPADLAWRSIGIAVIGPMTSGAPLIEGNDIAGRGADEASIGVLLDGATTDRAVAIVKKNAIRAGAAQLSAAVFAPASGAGSVLEQNDIFAGTSNAQAAVIGGSWGVVVGSRTTIPGPAPTLAIDRNRINRPASPTAAVGGCAGGNGAPFCGGGILGVSAEAVITNNVVFGVNGTRTAALFLTTNGTPEPPVVVVNANTLHGGGSALNPAVGSLSTAVALSAGEVQGLVYLGRFRNNIFVGGTNQARYGVYETETPNRKAHALVLNYNDFWNVAGGAGDPALVYHAWLGSSAADYKVTQIESYIGAGEVANKNRSEDPKFKPNDPLLHLDPNSPCIDVGTSQEAPKIDYDGQPRPFVAGGTVDMGADEVR